MHTCDRLATGKRKIYTLLVARLKLLQHVIANGCELLVVLLLGRQLALRLRQLGLNQLHLCGQDLDLILVLLANVGDFGVRPLNLLLCMGFELLIALLGLLQRLLRCLHRSLQSLFVLSQVCGHLLELLVLVMQVSKCLLCLVQIRRKLRFLGLEGNDGVGLCGLLVGHHSHHGLLKLVDDKLHLSPVLPLLGKLRAQRLDFRLLFCRNLRGCRFDSLLHTSPQVCLSVSKTGAWGSLEASAGSQAIPIGMRRQRRWAMQSPVRCTGEGKGVIQLVGLNHRLHVQLREQIRNRDRHRRCCA
eukprot:m.230944 g.230944  ORF g.230944 m.230944 type:complete len:301 (-) comp12137_c0_seq1:267-1169(-)